MSQCQQEKPDTYSVSTFPGGNSLHCPTERQKVNPIKISYTADKHKGLTKHHIYFFFPSYNILQYYESFCYTIQLTAKANPLSCIYLSLQSFE